jgi:hypothetical protein
LTVTANSDKRPRSKRRELAPLEPVDAQDGPKMMALPTDRHRAFVRAMYQVKPGHGAAVKAAKLAGFGTPESTPQSMATIASRLTHDPRVQEAFAEHDQLYIRAKRAARYPRLVITDRKSEVKRSRPRNRNGIRSRASCGNRSQREG